MKHHFFYLNYNGKKTKQFHLSIMDHLILSLLIDGKKKLKQIHLSTMGYLGLSLLIDFSNKPTLLISIIARN